MKFEFLLLGEASTACRQSLEYDPSNTEICICPHHKITFLYVLMNVAEADAVWHLRFFRKCTIWWLHDKGLNMFPNSECTMFIFKLADEKKKSSYTAQRYTKDLQMLSPPPQWFLNATVNMEWSHSLSTVNPQSTTVFWQLNRRGEAMSTAQHFLWMQMLEDHNFITRENRSCVTRVTETQCTWQLLFTYEKHNFLLYSH